MYNNPYLINKSPFPSLEIKVLLHEINICLLTS